MTDSPDPKRDAQEADGEIVEIARFSSRIEAETVGHALDQHGIPFLVKSDDVGMFGPGMTGMNPLGAGLLVPASCKAVVEELLRCVVHPEQAEGLPEDDALDDTALDEPASDDP